MTILVLLFFAELLGHLASGQVECLDGDIRLVHDTITMSSKTGGDFVEYCSGGIWRRLCVGDGRWRNSHANLACIQLGFNSTGKQGGGCSENPTSSFYKLQQSCDPMSDALVECAEGELVECTCTGNFSQGWVECLQASCDNGDVRLVNGSNPGEGRMEVCVAGEFGQHWGTVCSNQTELQNMLIAEQACRQLGFEGPSFEAVLSQTFGPGVVPRSRCMVNNGMIECVDAGLDCGHELDLGFQCQPTEPPTTPGATVVVTEDDLTTGLQDNSTEASVTSTNVAVQGLAGVVGVLAAVEAATVAVLVVAGIAYKKGKDLFGKASPNLERGESNTVRPIRYKHLSKKNERAKNETSQAIPDDHEPVVVVQSALQGSHAIEPIASNQNQDPVSGDLGSDQTKSKYVENDQKSKSSATDLEIDPTKKIGQSDYANVDKPDSQKATNSESGNLDTATNKTRQTEYDPATQNAGQTEYASIDQPAKLAVRRESNERRRQMLGDIGKQQDMDKPGNQIADEHKLAQDKPDESKDTLINEAFDISQ